MGLLDFLSGGGNSGPAPDLYAGALLPEQMAAIRQRSLGGAMAGLLKSGALDYTVPFISGKVPTGLAGGLAGAAAGAQDAQDQSANVGLKAQEFLLNRTKQQAMLAGLQAYMKGLGDLNGTDAAPASGGATPPEAGGQGGAAQGGSPGAEMPTDAASAAGLVKKYESAGGNYNIGFGGADLSKAPLRDDGFPQWSGNQGPQGVSHAAGAYQFEPSTWHTYATQLGIHDFSPASQDKVFAAAFADQGWKPWAPYNPQLRAALASGAGQPAQAASGGGQPPIRLAQNGAPTSIPMLPPSGGAGPQGMPGAAPGMPPSLLNHLGAGGPMSMPSDAGASPGATPTPQIANGTNAPPPPPAAMPQGLIPGAGAAPPPSGIPPVTQPIPAAPQQGAAPAQMPAVPSAALTPAQQLQAKRAQALTGIASFLGLKPPGFAEKYSELPLVGPTAAATAEAQNASKLRYAGPTAAAEARAKFPYTFGRPGGALPEVDANGNPTGRFTTVPMLGERTNPDGSQSPAFTQLTPQGAVTTPVGGTTKLGPGQTAQLEQTGKNTANLGPTNPLTPQGMSSADTMPKVSPYGVIPPLSEQKLPQSAAEADKAIPAWQDRVTDWTKGIDAARQAEQRLTTIAQAFKATATGAWSTEKAALAARLKTVGVTLPDNILNDPAAVQLALHENILTTLPLLKAATPRPSQVEFITTSENREHPNVQPEANLQMLSEDIALMRQAQNLPAAYNASGWRNPLSFETAYFARNPLQPMVERVQKEIGPLKGMPGYQAPGSPQLNPVPDSVRSEAQSAIMKGAPKAAVIKRLQEHGYDPSGF